MAKAPLTQTIPAAPAPEDESPLLQRRKETLAASGMNYDDLASVAADRRVRLTAADAAVRAANAAVYKARQARDVGAIAQARGEQDMANLAKKRALAEFVQANSAVTPSARDQTPQERSDARSNLIAQYPTARAAVQDQAAGDVQRARAAVNANAARAKVEEAMRFFSPTGVNPGNTPVKDMTSAYEAYPAGSPQGAVARELGAGSPAQQAIAARRQNGLEQQLGQAVLDQRALAGSPQNIEFARDTVEPFDPARIPASVTGEATAYGQERVLAQTRADADAMTQQAQANRDQSRAKLDLNLSTLGGTDPSPAVRAGSKPDSGVQSQIPFDVTDQAAVRELSDTFDAVNGVAPNLPANLDVPSMKFPVEQFGTIQQIREKTDKALNDYYAPVVQVEKTVQGLNNAVARLGVSASAGPENAVAVANLARSLLDRVPVEAVSASVAKLAEQHAEYVNLKNAAKGQARQMYQVIENGIKQAHDRQNTLRATLLRIRTDLQNLAK